MGARTVMGATFKFGAGGGRRAAAQSAAVAAPQAAGATGGDRQPMRRYDTRKQALGLRATDGGFDDFNDM